MRLEWAWEKERSFWRIVIIVDLVEESVGFRLFFFIVDFAVNRFLLYVLWTTYSILILRPLRVFLVAEMLVFRDWWFDLSSWWMHFFVLKVALNLLDWTVGKVLRWDLARERENKNRLSEKNPARIPVCRCTCVDRLFWVLCNSCQCVLLWSSRKAFPSQRWKQSLHSLWCA